MVRKVLRLRSRPVRPRPPKRYKRSSDGKPVGHAGPPDSVGGASLGPLVAPRSLRGRLGVHKRPGQTADPLPQDVGFFFDEGLPTSTSKSILFGNGPFLLPVFGDIAEDG